MKEHRLLLDVSFVFLHLSTAVCTKQYLHGSAYGLTY